MRQAISAGSIVPFYQPKVSLTTGRITGFEALARWRHPERGLLAAASFASAFDNPELAVALGRSMFEQVAADLRNWIDLGIDCGGVAVNLSTAEFTLPDLGDRLLGIFDAARVPRSLLEVEVTETVFLGRTAEHVGAILDQIHRSGIRIALDDFGTGYASLTHVKQFPVDCIKIDRSFIRDLEDDPNDEAIVTAVIGLGKSLNLEVVAEGVETPGQAHRLLMKGCDVAQGYLYGRPMSAAQVPAYLDAWQDKGLEDVSLRA
jgi:EAL domain-containing protein (putative c-di-GMP-specific phosphodiesterase class I)